MEIKEFLTKVNFEKGKNRNIKYIVIHYTGNSNDTAFNNCKYFFSVKRNASAHYFVDENNIYRCVKDENIAWHCGAKAYKHSYCRNSNSIGVELCTKKGENFYFDEKTVKNAVELVKMLMEKYNIPITNVLRHYDVTGKICPEPYVRKGEDWLDFKINLTKKGTKDMTKEETLKLINENKEKIYNSLADVPDWGKATVEKLINKGALQGNDKGLDLSYSLLRLLVINDRMGLYNG